MPTKADRKTFEEAIREHNQDQIRALLQRNDVKELLLMKDDDGRSPIHDACRLQLDEVCLQLILDAAVKHGIAKEILEAKTSTGSTCLHSACTKNLSTNSLELQNKCLKRRMNMV